MDKADPIIGIWKLNVANSKFSPVLLKAMNETISKEATETYKLIGDQIELTVENTMTGGGRISAYRWNKSPLKMGPETTGSPQPLITGYM